MRRVTDITENGVRLRTYDPDARESRHPLVVIHGGGWVWGGLDEVDALAAALAVATGRFTVSVGYRLAPEHRYPAALEDVLAGLDWVAAAASRLGVDPADTVLFGLSAGASLVAAATSARRGALKCRIAAQVLCYPMLDPDLSSESATRYADIAPLSRNRAVWFWDQYAPGATRQDPGAVPLLDPDLSALPPTHVVLAEHDLLVDEGRDYVQRINAAGGSADVVVWPGAVHGFLTMAGLAPDLCAAAVAEVAGWLATRRLDRPPGHTVQKRNRDALKRYESPR
jgi:acetyl esterase